MVLRIVYRATKTSKLSTEQETVNDMIRHSTIEANATLVETEVVECVVEEMIDITIDNDLSTMEDLMLKLSDSFEQSQYSLISIHVVNDEDEYDNTTSFISAYKKMIERLEVKIETLKERLKDTVIVSSSSQIKYIVKFRITGEASYKQSLEFDKKSEAQFCMNVLKDIHNAPVAMKVAVTNVLELPTNFDWDRHEFSYITLHESRTIETKIGE